MALLKTLPRSGIPEKLGENERAIEENPQVNNEALRALVNYKVSQQTIGDCVKHLKCAEICHTTIAPNNS